jgi:hypothetical protein
VAAQRNNRAEDHHERTTTRFAHSGRCVRHGCCGGCTDRTQRHRHHRGVPGRPLGDRGRPCDGGGSQRRTARGVLGRPARLEARRRLHDAPRRLPPTPQRRLLHDPHQRQRPPRRRRQHRGRLRFHGGRTIHPWCARRNDHAHRPAHPEEGQLLSFRFRFLSDEYPEFVGDEFNDAFIAELNASNWTAATKQDPSIDAPRNFAVTTDRQPIRINRAGATAMTAARAKGTTYDGATRILRASTRVNRATRHLYLSIFDQGDRVYDSAVFIDKLIVGRRSRCATGVAVER